MGEVRFLEVVREGWLVGWVKQKADGLCMRRSDWICIIHVNAVNVGPRYILKAWVLSCGIISIVRCRPSSDPRC